MRSSSTTGTPRSSRSASPRPDNRAPRHRAWPWLHSSSDISRPCGCSHTMSFASESRTARPRKYVRRRNSGCVLRSAITRRANVEQARPRRRGPSDIHEISLSWQYALLLPRCVRPISSPPASIGTPCEKQERRQEVAHLAQRAARGSRGRRSDLRRRSSSFGCVASPSRLSSPLASLCFSLYEHEVAQRETVVRGDEIDRSPSAAAAGRVQSRCEPERRRRELADEPAVAFPERAHGVAIAAVPLRPAGRKAADLIAAFAEVPRLGDQLDAARARDPGGRCRRTRRSWSNACMLAGERRPRGRSETRRRASRSPSSAGCP